MVSYAYVNPNINVEHVTITVDIDADLYPIDSIKIVFEPLRQSGSSYAYDDSQQSILLDGDQSAPDESSYVIGADGHRHLQFAFGSVKYRGESMGEDPWVVRIFSNGGEITPSANWNLMVSGSNQAESRQWIFTDEYGGGASITSTLGDSFNAVAATGNNIIDLNAGSRSSINGDAVTVLGGLSKGFGGDGNDTLYANSLFDSLLDGGRGNDTLVNGAGNDIVRGGQGTDTVRYDGNYYDYVVASENGVITITDGSGILDTLTGVEFIQFADITVPVSGLTPIEADPSTTNEDTIAILAAEDLLTEFGLVLDSVVATSAKGASISIQNGNVVYDPRSTSALQGLAAGATTTDTLTYTMRDSVGALTVGTVTMTITGVNDAPQAQARILSTDEDSPLTITAASLLAGATDIDDDTLSLVSVGNASGGAVALSDGYVTFTPNSHYSGTAGFNYTISDGHGGTTTEHVTINVAQVGPTLTLSAFEDVTLNISAGTMRAALGISSASSYAVSNLDGCNLWVPPDGHVEFTSNTNFNGTASFDYTIFDAQGGSSTLHVVVYVAPINDAPQALDMTIGADEDTVLTIAAASLLAGASDVDGDTLSVASVGSATGGTVTLATDGAVTFSPNANFNGDAGFDYTVSDGQGASVTQHVTVNVAAVNDAPVAQAHALSTSENTPLTVMAATLLAGASDIDGDSLSVVAVDNASNGTVSIVDGNAVFTPNNGYKGAAGFDYTVSDGHGGTVTQHVTIGVVDKIKTVATDEDTALTIAAATLVEGITNANGEAMSITSLSNAVGGTAVLASNGSVTFTPNANFNGIAGFDYVLTDGNGASASNHATVNVAPVNDVPVVSGSVSFTASQARPITITRQQLLASVTDVDTSDLLQVTNLSIPNGTLQNNDDGTWTFRPNTLFTGAINLTYQVSDGHVSVLATAVINVTAHGGFTVYGSNGPDLLPAYGNMNVYGGDGNDTFTIDLGVGNNIVDGGGGDDNIQTHSTSSENIIDGGIGNDVFSLTTINSSLIYGGSGNDEFSIISGEGNEIYGEGGDDYFYSAGTNNTFYGGGGNDTVLVAGSIFFGDAFIGGDGIDTLSFYASPYALADSFTVNLGAGTVKKNNYSYEAPVSEFENLIGSSGNDTLIGDEGDNVIDGRGSPGSDTLIGGGGYDTYMIGVSRLSTVFVDNRSSDGVSAANGEIDFGAGVSSDKLWFSQVGSDLRINILGGLQSVIVRAWYSGDVRAQVQSFETTDGLKLDNQLAQLVSAMATYSAANLGFNPASASQMPVDSSIQSAIASAWH